ncbi:MAG: alpha/beta hydrolase [Desulfomonilia bacterium]|nr:alpha/beta hydrolase [Desulfomonilia bacterium]
MKRVDSDFFSNGLRCSGWLFLPDGAQKPPVIVMAHGIAVQKDFGLQNYAEYFVSKGMASYVFDYRNFGGSEGQPRNLVNPWRHLADWRAAITHVKGLSDVNPELLALWGTSFSGGHVVVTAAKVKGIRAVVAQVPFVDGISSAMQLPVSYQASGVYHGLWDVFNLVRGRAPHTVPAVAEPETFALMNTLEYMEGFSALVPENTTWKNEVPARILLTISSYRPITYSRRIPCPVLLVYAKRDSLIPYQTVEKMGRAIPRAELLGLDAGHFDVYTGKLFAQVVEKQADFLSRHLSWR